MPQDAAQIRGRIISFIRDNGPSLPVQISKETGLSILFASAFLSELYGEKIINISNLRVGSSPLYFIPGQEPQLERFSQYVKGKEKEAYLLLKEKAILRDSELQPAIRVALREIKDFAVPFEKNNEIFWRYFLVKEPERIEINIIEIAEQPEENSIIENNFANTNFSHRGGESLHEHQFQNESVGSSRGGMDERNQKLGQEEVKEEKINIGEEIFQENISLGASGREFSRVPEKEGITKENFDEAEKNIKIKKETTHKEKSPKKTENKVKKTDKKDDNFFNKIKDFLSKKEIEIVDIKEFKNNEALLKVKKNDKEQLLFAFNKKKITEKEILGAYKKATEENIPYSILSLGETTKKLGDLISAIKNLSEIGKIE